jgi:hypothetical protein
LIQIVCGAKEKQRSETKTASIGKIQKATARGKQCGVGWQTACVSGIFLSAQRISTHLTKWKILIIF